MPSGLPRGRPKAAPVMPIRQLDLNLLRVLVEIHDAGGVTAACVRLHLSQPAVSNALARLRATLDDDLFVRSSRGLAPTAYTERILPTVRDALARLGDALARDAAFDPQRSARSFRVAMTDAGELVFIPKLVAALAREAPQLRLEIVPLAFEALEDALADGTVDIAIGPLSLRQAGDLRVTPLFSERYCGLVRADGQLARRAGVRRRLPAAVLKSARLVAVIQPNTRHRVILDALAALDLERNVIGRVPHFMALPPLVDGYDALAVVPSQIAAIFERRGLGRGVEIPLRLSAYEVVMARHRRFDRDAGLGWFESLVARMLSAPLGRRAPPRAGRTTRA